LVQAHVADEFKGRVFVIYDIIFNVALVAAAVIAAVIMPASGKSVPILIIMAICYVLITLWFALVTRGLSMNEGRIPSGRFLTATLKILKIAPERKPPVRFHAQLVL
jgi:hypothetical protein